MALDVQVGSFSKDSSGTDNATQDVTTTGITPKAIILWGNYYQTSVGEEGGDSLFCVGFSDGTNHVSLCMASDDAVTTTDYARFQRETLCLVFEDADFSIQAEATVAFASGKFTMTWTENTDTTATLVNYIVFGGDDIDGAQVNSFSGSGSTGTQSLTTDSDVQSISDGEGIVFLMGFQATNSGSAALTHSSFFLGAATSASDEFACSFAHYPHGGASGAVENGFQSDSCIYETAGALRAEANFVQFDADGFDVNWSTASNRRYHYLIIKGGQWQAGSDSVKTSTGTQAYTTDFQPSCLITVGNRRTSDGFGTTEDMSYNLGAVEGSTHVSSGVTEDDGVGTTVVGRMASSTKVTRILDPTADPPTVDTEADLDSFNSTDFTLDHTTADGTAYLFGWIVCADAAGGPTLSTAKPTVSAIIG